MQAGRPWPETKVASYNLEWPKDYTIVSLVTSHNVAVTIIGYHHDATSSYRLEPNLRE